MTIEAHLRRRALPALAIGLVALALAAPAGFAQSSDLRPKAPNSSLAGTTSSSANPHARTRADVTAALAQEDYYSSYRDPAPPAPAAPGLGVTADDGIAPLPFVLAMVGALIVGIGATSGIHALARRRARPA